MTNPDAPSVLLVDDAANERARYAESLRDFGFRTREAGDALTAYQQAVADPPDIIITEILMPGVLDGIGLTRKLTANPQTRMIVIVVLSGCATRVRREEAARAGVVCFLTKPCRPADLASEARRLLGLSRELSVRSERTQAP
jgi:CheY-like chemotaxis protein